MLIDMDLDNPIAVRLVVDAGHAPLRGVLECAGQAATEFQGMLQLLELLGRLTVDPSNDANPLPRTSK
jgi:hypothetical protein